VKIGRPFGLTLAALTTTAAVLLSCTLDFDRYDPAGPDAEPGPPADAEAPRDAPSQADAAPGDGGPADSAAGPDAPPLCTAPTVCFRQASSCGSACVQSYQQCGLSCAGTTCAQTCLSTQQSCLGKCATTCIACAQDAGCPATSQCLNATHTLVD
jgi:hypothetical protein